MKLINRLKRKYKLWRMSFHDRELKRKIRRAKLFKFFTGQKHYVLFDYQNRMVVINTLMLEQYKKNRLVKRNWSNHILFETK